jgi:hypothetical protein
MHAKYFCILFLFLCDNALKSAKICTKFFLIFLCEKTKKKVYIYIIQRYATMMLFKKAWPCNLKENLSRKNFENKREFYKPLQDFTVLPTEIFRRCVITSLSVIYLPTDYIRRLFFHR